MNAINCLLSASQVRVYYQLIGLYTDINIYMYSCFCAGVCIRSNCSTRNGYVGWPSREKMEEGLISAGWEWEEGSIWQLHTALGETDENGWVYAVSFGSIEDEGMPSCGRTHFVRRRRKTRKQVFIGN